MTRIDTKQIAALQPAALREPGNAPDELLEAITSVERPGPRPARRPARLPVLLTGAAAVAAAAAIMIPLAGGSHSPARPGSEAQSFLLSSADRAAKAPVATTGTYWHVRQITCDPGFHNDQPPVSFRACFNDDTWTTKSGRVLTVNSLNRIIFNTPRDEANWKASGSKPLVLGGWQRYQIDRRAVDATYTKILALPADPAQLRKLVIQHGGGDGDVNVDLAVDVPGLMVDPVPPATRAALYRILAAIPGTRVHGTSTDAQGRKLITLLFPDTRGPGYSLETFVKATGAFVSWVNGAGRGASSVFNETTTQQVLAEWTNTPGKPAGVQYH